MVSGVGTALPAAVGEVLGRLGLDRATIDREQREMSTIEVAATGIQSDVGSMNESAFLADATAANHAD